MVRSLVGDLACATLLAVSAPLGADVLMFERVPEPNPPVSQLEAPQAPESREIQALEPFPAPAPTSTPTVEWSFHKTADNQHPDGNEQQMTWLLNRARTNPTQEGIWLAAISDPDIVAARTYWGVDTGVLRSAFAAIPARPPAAFDARLYAAAKAHSDYVISVDRQTHDGQLDLVAASGFKYQYWAGIVFAYSEYSVYGHAGFNIDWGVGPYGMQDPPGHRKAIMSLIDNAPAAVFYSNVGYAVVSETNPSTQVGPQVIAGNLAYANTGYPDLYNVFIVGTVWEDTNGNGRYDPGEGVAGVTVMPDGGTYYAVTGIAGGYAIPVGNGTYTVTFSGGDLVGAYTRTVSVSGSSVLQDLEYYSASNGTYNPGAWGGSSPSTDTGSGGGGGGGGCFLATAGTETTGMPAITALASLAAALFLARRCGGVPPARH